jgi:glutamyl-tRNA reductase
MLAVDQADCPAARCPWSWVERDAAGIEEEKESFMSLAKAVVVGVGAEDGLGAALSRCYAANDRHVLVAGRSLEKVEKVATAIRRSGGRATAYAVDATREEDVIRLFDTVTGGLYLSFPMSSTRRIFLAWRR